MDDNKLLSEEDIRFHLSALKKLAMADGVYDDSEKRFIDQITQVYISSYPDLDFETMQKKELSDEEYAQGLENLKQNKLRAKLLLKDLITLGHADGDYSEPERKLVQEISEKLNLSKEYVRLLEKAVDDMLRATLFMNNVLFS